MRNRSPRCTCPHWERAWRNVPAMREGPLPKVPPSCHGAVSLKLYARYSPWIDDLKSLGDSYLRGDLRAWEWWKLVSPLLCAASGTSIAIYPSTGVPWPWKLLDLMYVKGTIPHQTNYWVQNQLDLASFEFYPGQATTLSSANKDFELHGKNS